MTQQDQRIGASLSLRGLNKVYGNSAAVCDAELEMLPGEFVTLLGASGSGKTTTLMMIAGFIEPTSGEIAIDGKSVVGLPPAKRDLGVVFQNYSLFPHLTVGENIGFPLRMRGMGRAQRRARVQEMLDMVHLPDRADSYPRQLSGGQQQRVALARALVFRPRVLLMDEPLGALDKKLREHMQSEIKRIHHELGATVMCVTHDQEEALTMSDRVAVMDGGRIVQIGRPADLYDRPATRWVADFIGQSSFIEVVVMGADSAGLSTVRLPDGSVVRVRSDAMLATAARATLVLRPERLHLAAAHESVPSGMNHCCGIVRDAAFVGPATRYEIALTNAGRIQVQEANRSGSILPKVGDTVQIAWAYDDGWLLAEAAA